MHLSPQLYHRFVRPRWFTKKYIHDHITNHATLANKMVLDFGCGTGAICGLCEADHYYGIDPDAGRIQFAKRLYPAHTFMVFNGTQIPLPDNTVDLIFVVAVLHHISNQQITGYLHEFRRVLKPEGNVMVIEPFLCPKNKFNNWFMKRHDNGAFIRTADEYLQLFSTRRYECEVLKKFKKCFLYHELLFTASPSRNGV
jgi:ubiquinone/menaquinone biosynthesis C-methylase UbiE